MTPAVAHYYRTFRGEMERSAESALSSARQHVNFLARLDAMVRTSRRRSRAAKRAWKNRKAQRQQTGARL